MSSWDYIVVIFVLSCLVIIDLLLMLYLRVWRSFVLLVLEIVVGLFYVLMYWVFMFCILISFCKIWLVIVVFVCEVCLKSKLGGIGYLIIFYIIVEDV